jgi:hypothetical protein
MRTNITLPYTLKVASVLGLALAVSGCAGGSAARDMSAAAAKLTDDYKSDSQRFFQAQDVMVHGTVESIESRKQLAAVLNDQTRVQRASWQASKNTAALQIYDSLSAQSDTAILTSNIDLQSLQPVVVPAAISIDPKPFESVTSTLNQMAQPPSLKEEGSFLFKEAQDVANQYKQSLTDGAKCANKATSSAKQPAPSDRQPAAAPSPAPSGC